MMTFLRDIAGTVSTLSLAVVVAYYTNLQLYAVVCMGIQWISALYAIPKQDEHYFDLTGSITEDKRFKEIRENPLQFLGVWNIQGLWVLLTLLPVLLTLSHGTSNSQVSLLDAFGVFLWIVGYVLEVTADYQKMQFRRNKSNMGQFIQGGLWYYSRHPNYCGEIMIWIGVFCVSVHTLPTTSLQCWAAVSPMFVAFLLLFVSGVPLLESQAEDRWGKTTAWQEYKAQTSVLLPMPKHKIKTK
ncbi:unnamed protein product [Peronospora belbahrii]|uniref:Steroid 5-alpha reductase C-terminal domain-containing protein n=1 Tax=Peronospora belbahrii TaxID=622444 RepID=A0ABN8CTR0_9STRA|nr:unnamed protein product [Peronospora belbahrii]